MNEQIRKSHFSKIGLFYALCSVMIYVIQLGTLKLISMAVPDFFDQNPNMRFVIAMSVLFLVAYPIMIFIIKKIPVPETAVVEKTKFSGKQMFVIFTIAYAGMYISNLVGVLLTTIIGVVKGSAVTNSILEAATSNNLLVNFIFMVIGAPIAEEYIFRKLLMDRILPYGEGIAVFTTALFFGLFHGNVNQFVYAFVLGGVFGYVYAKTRDVKYTIVLHMIINFFGSIAGVLMLRLSGLQDIMGVSQDVMVEIITQNIGGILLFVLYAVCLLVIVILGIVFFFTNLKKLSFEKTELSVEKGERAKAFFANPGMIFYFVFWISMIIYSLWL